MKIAPRFTGLKLRAEDRTALLKMQRGRAPLSPRRWRRIRVLLLLDADMWRACINVVARWAPQAVHVLDRFHIVSRLNDAVDRVRRDERRDLARAGFEPIKHSRWCFLKRPEDLTPAPG